MPVCHQTFPRHMAWVVVGMTVPGGLKTKQAGRTNRQTGHSLWETGAVLGKQTFHAYLPPASLRTSHSMPQTCRCIIPRQGQTSQGKRKKNTTPFPVPPMPVWMVVGDLPTFFPCLRWAPSSPTEGRTPARLSSLPCSAGKKNLVSLIF